MTGGETNLTRAVQHTHTINRKLKSSISGRNKVLVWKQRTLILLGEERVVIASYQRIITKCAAFEELLQPK